MKTANRTVNSNNNNNLSHLDVRAVHPHHEVEEHLSRLHPDVDVVEAVFRSLEAQPHLHTRHLPNEGTQEDDKKKTQYSRQL